LTNKNLTLIALKQENSIPFSEDDKALIKKLHLFRDVTFYLFLQGGLYPSLRPSINCSPMRNPNITKG